MGHKFVPYSERCPHGNNVRECFTCVRARESQHPLTPEHVTAEETAALREVFVPVNSQTTGAALGDLRQLALAYGAACRVSGVGTDVATAWNALDKALVEACQL